MARSARRILHWFFQIRSASVAPALGLALAFGLGAGATEMQGQTYSVIHRFDYYDGSQPEAGVTIDRAGNLYGTTYNGGTYSGGEVYKLTRFGSHWLFNILYSFAGGSDGAHPYTGALVFGPDGALYGTTYAGGNGGCGSLGFGCGTVFRLSPPPTICVNALCSWTETVLYRFSGGADGASPRAGVTFDQAGNLYGTTVNGGLTSGGCGTEGCGVVFELAHSGGSWTESVIHTFTPGGDGLYPFGGLTFDTAGNLYGTTTSGGSYDQGTVFQLTSPGSGWTETILYNFTGGADGSIPTANLIFDSSGKIYGTASNGGQAGDKVFGERDLSINPARPLIVLPPAEGTAFTLTPNGGNWAFDLLYTFTLANDGGEGPLYSVVMDSAGNLYGTVIGGGLPPAYDGAAYKLTPGSPEWTYTPLFQFTEDGNGADPECALVFDASGNLYGTALGGAGVVFQIAP